MDIDGFPLAAISEKSIIDNDIQQVKSRAYAKQTQNHSVNSNDSTENGDISISSPNHVSTPNVHQTTSLETSTHSEPISTNIDHTKTLNQSEVTSIPDEDDNNTERDERIPSQRPSQLINDHDSTMISSYGTGSDNDIIEIHQFSTADIDAYLDIYFETLDNRLRHHIGQDEQLQQFRTAMRNRINSDTNAREYQNVLLGKINGEVLAAVTVLFPGEIPTISQPENIPQENSCLTSIRRRMARKANYIPTNIEECYIEMIGVKDAYRSHGIGSAMLECVEHFAQQAGANLLTIHTQGQRVQTFLERYGFNIDRTDNSSIWKWMFERQNISKLSKAVTLNEENIDYTAGSYINESIAESVDE